MKKSGRFEVSGVDQYCNELQDRHDVVHCDLVVVVAVALFQTFRGDVHGVICGIAGKENGICDFDLSVYVNIAVEK